MAVIAVIVLGFVFILVVFYLLYLSFDFEDKDEASEMIRHFKKVNMQKLERQIRHEQFLQSEQKRELVNYMLQLNDFAKDGNEHI